MDYYLLVNELRNVSDKDKAIQMKAYMRDQFEYLGIPTPLRKSISKQYFKEAHKDSEIDWDFIDKCWACEYRELQYVAVGYLNTMQNLLKPTDIPRIRELAVQKSWWDTIDGLDALIGGIALIYPEVNEILIKWSTDENFWLRRIAIDHQLKRKTETDTELLETVIVNNFGQKEFFINKAIGWSLREYSKTDPEWVRSFVDKHRDKMAPLSIKEASKYI